MKITKDDDKALIIVVSPGWLEWLFLSLSILSVCYLIKSYVQTPKEMENIYGAGGSAIFLFLAYMAFYEKAAFHFNKISQSLIWWQHGFFRKNRGVVSFSEITKVYMQIGTGDDSSPNYRVVLNTNTADLALTNAYLADKSLCTKIADRVSEIISLDHDNLVISSVEEMVKQNRLIDAVKLLMDEKGYSLTEAKQIADKIKKRI